MTQYAQSTGPQFRLLDIRKRAERAACETSGLDPHRAQKYIGLSKAGWCPAYLYDLWFKDASANGVPGLAAHLRCLSGYMYEAKMLDILVAGGIAKPRPLIKDTGKLQDFFTTVTAPFSTDSIPVRGHTDGETTREFGEQLIEITTANADDYRRLTRAPDDPQGLMQFFRNKVFQIQAYLRWGKNEQGKPYERCLFCIVSRGDERDALRWWFVEVSRNDTIGDQVEMRLIKIVSAVVRRERPLCECADRRHVPAEVRTGTIATAGGSVQAFDPNGQPAQTIVALADDYFTPRNKVGTN